MSNKNRFDLSISEDGDIAYLKLPSHPRTERCAMSRSIRLIEVMPDYKGPDVVLDFHEGVLVGIEILADQIILIAR